MVLYVLRGVFILLVATVTALYVLPFQQERARDFTDVVAALSATLGLAAVIIIVDVGARHKKLAAISGAFLGLLAGLVAAYALSFVVDLVGLLTAPEVTAPEPQRYSEADLNVLARGRVRNQLEQTHRYRTEEEIKALSPEERRQYLAEVEALTQAEAVRFRQEIDSSAREHAARVRWRASYLNVLQGVKVFIGLITCYLGMSLVIQTRDDFRFVLPYVEFARQIRGPRPLVLDTSVIIDGRVLEVVRTQFLQGTLVVPRFVISELHALADSADKLKRARGRRGLDMLQKLQADPAAGVSIDDSEVEGGGADLQLLALCQHRQARLMTNDFNLAKVAALQKIEVLNLNDLSTALRPVALPGDSLKVKLVKPGEGANQGVGYLDDGTMVVVEGGRPLIGQELEATVTSTLQTSAGRMIFARAPAGGNG